MPSNPKFQPIRVDRDNEFLVWGVVKYGIEIVFIHIIP